MKSKSLDWTQLDVVIFDLDGTLIDSRHDLCDALNHAMALEGLPAITVEHMVKQISRGTKDYLRSITGGDTARVESIFKNYARHYRQNSLVKTTLYPRTLELLNHFHKKVPMAVMSNKHQTSCEIVMKGLSIDHYFEMIVGGDVVGKKPDPAPLLLICEKLGVEASKGVMIGDSPFDLQAAKAIGMKCIGLLGGFVPAQEVLQEGAHAFFLDPDELFQSILATENVSTSS
ncbi:MAG: HAD family hydrolase [Bdellovibrionota bacterium]